MTIHMDRTISNVASLVVDAFQVSTVSTPTSFARHNYQRRNAKVYNNYYARRTHDDNDDDNITNNHDDDNDNDTISNNLLRRRMYPLQVATLEQIYQRSLPISTTTTSRTSSSSSSSPDSNDSNSNHQYNRNKNNNNIHSTHHPIPFIEFCLHCLLQSDIPYPDSGIRFLLRVSTKPWKQQIYQSIGYHHHHYNKAIPQYHHHQRQRSLNSTFTNNDVHDNNSKSNVIPMHYNDDYDDTDQSKEVEEEEMISVISATISQVQNQFGILVGEGEPYRICFPSEPLEYDDIQPSDNTIIIHNHHDDDKSKNKNNIPQPSSTITTSTVWIECQLRHYDTNELLVIMGWQLLVVPTPYDEQKNTDDPKKHHSSQDNMKEYRIDRVDWQDFREMFRPGIGREEWIRICG